MAEIGSIGEPLLPGDGSSRPLEQHQIGRLGNGKGAHLHGGRRTCRLIMRCLGSEVLPAKSCQRCLASDVCRPGAGMKLLPLARTQQRRRHCSVKPHLSVLDSAGPYLFV